MYRSVSVLGVPLDFNSSHLRGPAQAPPIIRRVLMNGSANTTSESGIDVAKDARLEWVDAVNWDSDAEAFTEIERRCAELAHSGSKILTLGGDHSITFPVVKALAERHDNLTILHFDAHPDLYDNQDGNKHGHGCPFARIMEGKFAARLVQLGIRTLNRHQADQAEQFGVEVHEMKNWCVDTPLNLEGPLYISFDLDALDPAYAPGVSHFEPGGLSVREVLQVLHQIDVPVVGADIVEYNPKLDINEMTAMVCAKIYKELAALLLRDCAQQ
ncbi:MAG: agmatinase [Pseudomonadales bacterium]